MESIRESSDEEVLQLLRGATTVEEWIEVTKLLPSDDGGYDIVEALYENLVWSGEQPRDPK